MLAWSCGCCLDRTAYHDHHRRKACEDQTAHAAALPWILQKNDLVRQLHRQQEMTVINADCRRASEEKTSASTFTPVLPGPYPSSIRSDKLPEETRSVTWALVVSSLRDGPLEKSPRRLLSPRRSLLRTAQTSDPRETVSAFNPVL